MKVITKDILPFQENDFFLPLRDKINYARLIVLAARLLLLDYEIQTRVTSSMKLVVDKMSRLFFYKDNKYFSVSFPFTVLIDENDVITITTYSGRLVDNKSISDVISILEDEQFKLNPSPIDFYSGTNIHEYKGFLLLEEILQFEPAYIRYDMDAPNQKGKLHPLHHLDINYSSCGSYKLGLYHVIDAEYFENILNINTDCSFLTD